MGIRTTRRIAAPITLATGLVIALAACSGGGGGGGGGPTGDDKPSTDASPTDDYTPGPLEKLWSEAYGEFNMEVSSDQQNRVEQRVAECMSEQGFEYTPVDYSQMDDGFGVPIEGETDGPQWGTEEYAKEYGYGITTYDEGNSTAEPLPMPGEGGESEWTDPNMEYVESLSESAREAYYEALSGPQPTEEEMAEGDWEYDPANAGCYGKASEEVYNAGGNVFEDEKYKGLIEEMNLVYSAAEDDPQIAAARSEWTGCMTDAGFPGLGDPSAAQDLIYEEMREYWEGGTEPDEATMASIRDRERALATADFQCAEKSKINDIQVEVQHKIEQEFIDSHKAELEELMAALKEQQEAAKG